MLDDKTEDQEQPKKESSFLGDMMDAASDALESVKETVEDVVEAVSEKAEDIADKVEDMVEDAVDAAKDKAEDIVDAVKEKAAEAADKAEDMVEAAKDKAEDIVETVKDKAAEAADKAEDMVDAAKEKAGHAVEAVKETASEAADKAGELVDAAKEKASEVAVAATAVAAGAVASAKEKAEDVVEAVTGKTEEVAETVEAATEKVAKTTTKAAAEAKETVEAAARGIADTTTSSDDDDEDDVEIDVEVPTGATGEAHDDFDWSIDATADDTYTDEERNKMMADFDKSMSAIQEMEIVSGVVTAINDGDVVLDINFKSDGLIPLSEFRDTPNLGVGDHVEVYVELQEDARGQLVLSRRKAKLLRAWDSIKDSYENGTVIKGTVISKTKGGLIVDCSGLETFLPGSQIDIKPIIDYDSYVGKTMEFKVVKINEAIKNAVVSHKALIESDLAEQREAIIASLERGQVLEGLVKNITDFGAFLDLGGVDGLLYITDISWGRISHPSEVLELNQKINVVVLDFDENKKRISLGLKQLQPHPWEVLAAEINEGSTVKGKIVNIEDYGAFLEIQPGVEGLIHVSEVSWSNQPINAREYFKLGQEYEAKVVTVDREDRKMSLSVKQLMDDPWDKIEEKFPENSRHEGEVKNLTPYGVFVELENGIGGMIHISDLSWTKRYSHPSEFTKVGNKIDVMILEVDKNNRKLSLGHKQLEENPWDTFETVFPHGSYHEATILRKDDRGAIVQLPYGLEAYAPLKHIRKEDGTYAETDEALTIKVIEFNRDDKRIMVSHLRYLEDIRREADEQVRKEKDTERQETRQAVKKTQSSVERDTLGDLDVFSQLKQQLSDNEDADDE
jgi:small subunit ribosomal protein S1